MFVVGFFSVSVPLPPPLPLHYQTPGVVGSMLGLVGTVSVYYYRVKKRIRFATPS